MDSSLDLPEGPCFSRRMMDALFFSMAVYEPTPEAVLSDLHSKFGTVSSLMEFGFGEDGKQAIFAGRTSKGQIIVACRGTSGLKDVLQDLKYFHTRLAYARGAAHWGFAERAQSVPIDFFCKLLSAGEEIVFTGHSLGGAVASLLSLRVLEHTKGTYQQQVQCITFGSPLFASQSLAQIINSNYKDVFIHVISKKDVIPKILPVVSALQRLLYAGEDHLEGLSVLKKLLECIKWLPVAPLIKGIEQKIPGPLKFLLRCLMKLASPTHVTGSYAFAGHVVMLDSDATVESSLKLSNADDLNIWHSQLNFALGAGFDPSMIEHHGLNNYKDGILRAFAHVVINHEVTPWGAERLCVESTSIVSSGNSQPSSGDVEQRKKIFIRLTRNEEVGKEACEFLVQCTMNQDAGAKGLLSQGTFKDIDVWQKDIDGAEDILKYFEFMQSSGAELCALNTASGSRSVDLSAFFQHDTLACKQDSYGSSSCAISSSTSVTSTCNEGEVYTELHRTASCHMGNGKNKVCAKESQVMEGPGDNLTILQSQPSMSLIPFSSSGSSLCSKNHMYRSAASDKSGPNSVERGGSDKWPGHGARSLSRSRSGSSNSPCWPLHLEDFQAGFQADAKCCQACSSQEVCKRFKTRTAVTSVSKAIVREVGRKRFKFGWFLGTVGRVARHLRVLDNMCIFTFIKIALSNFLG